MCMYLARTSLTNQHHPDTIPSDQPCWLPGMSKLSFLTNLPCSMLNAVRWGRQHTLRLALSQGLGCSKFACNELHAIAAVCDMCKNVQQIRADLDSHMLASLLVIRHESRSSQFCWSMAWTPCILIHRSLMWVSFQGIAGDRSNILSPSVPLRVLLTTER